MCNRFGFGLLRFILKATSLNGTDSLLLLSPFVGFIHYTVQYYSVFQIL